MPDSQNPLAQRFPLLTSLRIGTGSGESEELATFMGVLLGAIQESRYASFCFIFPRKKGLAALSAVLYALGRFRVDFPKLAEEYAERSFQKGQRVRLVPEGQIYVFDGLWPGLETSFRLKYLNEKAFFTWPVSEILRIEPTLRKIPKGQIADAVRARNEAPLSSLDKLIGTRTFGNTCLAVNHVLYLGGRCEMEEFLDNTFFTSSAYKSPCFLGTLLTTGHIDGNGKIQPHNSYQAAGEPLIAMGSRIESVAAICERAPARSKVVIVDGANRITDLSQFDSIAERQNLIIVAEADEEEKLRELYDRGCRFWRFSLDDLEMKGQGSRGGRFFASVFRSARNESTLKTEVQTCPNAHLERLSIALEKCQGSLEESEGDETGLILGQIFGLMVHCSGLLEPPDAEERDRLRAKSQRIIAAAVARNMWLPDAPAAALKDACEALRHVIDDPQLGEAKGAALRALLDVFEHDGVTEIGIAARSVSNRLTVIRWLEKNGLSYPVLLPSNAAGSGFFERLICTAWPNSGQFGHLLRQHAAPAIYLIAYPFECRWFQLFTCRQRSTSPVPSLKSSEKSELVGVSCVWPEQPVAPSPVNTPITESFSTSYFEERFNRAAILPASEPGEDSVPARLARFVGDSYAFLTETLRIPVVTDLVSGAAGDGYKVPLRKLKEIRPGDVLVFRNGGRKDVIRALADAQLGPEAAVLRETAARWHLALRASGLGEAMLMHELEQVNCPRTPQTVHSWLSDDSMIGPQSRTDLEAIAYAVGDQKLLEAAPEIWNAIQTLRSEHLSAGLRLSRILLAKLPDRRAELREGKTYIEIDDVTGAWIVQVESIADAAELRPRSEINTVLSSEQDLFGEPLWQR